MTLRDTVAIALLFHDRPCGAAQHHGNEGKDPDRRQGRPKHHRDRLTPSNRSGPSPALVADEHLIAFT